MIGVDQESLSEQEAPIPDGVSRDRMELSAVLGQRRWLRRAHPFPHVIAYDVFELGVYRRLEQTFLELLGETAGQPYMERHDIEGRTVDQELAHRFEPLLLRGFHDVIADVLGVTATGHVAVGMHHHRPGGQHGFPHNDLNPGWFLGEPSPGQISVRASASTTHPVRFSTAAPRAL